MESGGKGDHGHGKGGCADFSKSECEAQEKLPCSWDDGKCAMKKKPTEEVCVEEMKACAADKECSLLHAKLLHYKLQEAKKDGKDGGKDGEGKGEGKGDHGGKDGEGKGEGKGKGDHDGKGDTGDEGKDDKQCGLLKYKGDGNCDDENNNKGSEYDGGDCCAKTVAGGEVSKKFCSKCECVDPDSQGQGK